MTTITLNQECPGYASLIPALDSESVNNSNNPCGTLHVCASKTVNYDMQHQMSQLKFWYMNMNEKKNSDKKLLIHIQVNNSVKSPLMILHCSLFSLLLFAQMLVPHPPEITEPFQQPNHESPSHFKMHMSCYYVHLLC